MRSDQTKAIYASKQIKVSSTLHAYDAASPFAYYPQIGTMSKEKRQKVFKEVNILRALRHPHIVRLFQRYTASHTPHACRLTTCSYETQDIFHIHMEYVDGIELAQLLKTEVCMHYMHALLFTSDV